MSDFGEKVFAALAHQVSFNNVGELQTGDSRVLNLNDPGLDFGKEGPVQIENFKNAIFQLLMLRARNEFQLHNSMNASPRFVKVDLSIIFTPLTIHPQEKDKEKDAFLGAMGINPNQVFPIASDQYDRDSLALLSDFSNDLFPLACGN